MVSQSSGIHRCPFSISIVTLQASGSPAKALDRMAEHYMRVYYDPDGGLDWHNNVLIQRGRGSGSHCQARSLAARWADSSKALVHNAVLILAGWTDGAVLL